MILRHDVDQHPRSALTISEIERTLGVRSTWYLRWRTADPKVIAELQRNGGEVGLHYETLTRRVLAERLPPETDLSSLLDECRRELQSEVRAFDELFGPIRSISAHGDSRVPWVRNLALVDGELRLEPDVYDANIAMRGHRLGCWLTDRSAAEGGWGDGVRPSGLMADGVSPIQCLVHPNNWSSGMSLWGDRALRALLPGPAAGDTARIRRTRSDSPPRASA
jgi:hypothetical protein